jgi:hypothetical protein
VPFQNDRAVISGTLTLGGTLTVLSPGIEPFEEGDAFDLFDAGVVSGEFSSESLPALDAGLAWDTSLLTTEGSIRVIASPEPTFNTVERAGGSLVLGGSGGFPGGDYYLLSSTNVGLPLSLWARLLTNQFDGNGDFMLTNPVASDDPLMFYSIEAP